MSGEKTKLTPAEFKKRNRRSFLVAALGALGSLIGIERILDASTINESPWPLRDGFRLNEKLWRGLFNSDRQNSRSPQLRPGTPGRVNGDVGLEKEIDLKTWRLRYDSPSGSKTMTLEEFSKLPRTASKSEFRCIEGWSMPITFEGVLFSDFLRAIDPTGSTLPYVGLETPDAAYYVGIDMESMLHSQTILADQMNGAPLGAEHGEPLRLIIPVKYGIKNLKRVGRIFLAQNRPRDYWAEQGYDWYSGL